MVSGDVCFDSGGVLEKQCISVVSNRSAHTGIDIVDYR